MTDGGRRAAAVMLHVPTTGQPGPEPGRGRCFAWGKKFGMTATQLNEHDRVGRLEQLREENLALEQEADGLRQFMECMGKLIEAVDRPQRESEVLTLLGQVLDSAIRAIGAKDGSLLVPDEETGELVFVIVQGQTTKPNLVGRRLPAGRGIAGWVAENRRGTTVNNVPADERFYPELDVELDYRTNSLMAAPLLGGNRLLGVVEVVNKQDGKLFSTGNLTLMALMCRFAGELLHGIISQSELTQSMQRVERA